MLSISLGMLSKSELRLGRGCFDMVKRCIMEVKIYVWKVKVCMREEED
jgi:hypothetical protein